MERNPRQLEDYSTEIKKLEESISGHCSFCSEYGIADRRNSFFALGKRGFRKEPFDGLCPKDAKKNRQIPINAKARRVLDFWALGRKNEFVFYNHETGKPFVDLDSWLALACKKAGITGKRGTGYDTPLQPVC